MGYCLLSNDVRSTQLANLSVVLVFDLMRMEIVYAACLRFLLLLLQTKGFYLRNTLTSQSSHNDAAARFTSRSGRKKKKKERGGRVKSDCMSNSSDFFFPTHNLPHITASCHTKRNTSRTQQIRQYWPLASYKIATRYSCFGFFFSWLFRSHSGLQETVCVATVGC